jgi:hypothetical protein
VSKDEFGFVFALLEEGAPEDEILNRIEERSRDDERFIRRLSEHIRIYRENVVDGAAIPEDVADYDGLYARDRRFSREVLPRLDSLILRLSGHSRN